MYRRKGHNSVAQCFPSLLCKGLRSSPSAAQKMGRSGYCFAVENCAGAELKPRVELNSACLHMAGYRAAKARKLSVSRAVFTRALSLGRLHSRRVVRLVMCSLNTRVGQGCSSVVA